MNLNASNCRPASGRFSCGKQPTAAYAEVAHCICGERCGPYPGTSCNSKKPPCYRQRGVALVLVLWVIVLLTVIAGAMATSQQAGVSMVSNARQERQGRALAAAGIQFMALQLGQPNKPPEEQQYRVDGQLRAWQFAGHTIWIGAMPDTGRVNLNMADEKLLAGMLLAAGLDEEQMEGVRDAILDWRDKDSEHRIAGAEDDAYEADGRPIGARDDVFQSVEELQQVMGVTPSLYKQLATRLTVHSMQRTVNPEFAYVDVLSSIPGITPEEVEAYQAARLQALEQGLPVPVPEGPYGQYFSKAAGPVFRVFAEVDLESGGKVEAEVIMNTQLRTAKGYKILERNYFPLINFGRAMNATVEEAG
jgi:general secretion pathway protein K